VKSGSNGGSRELDYRTIWISDLHLGTRGCQAGLLLEFLSHVRASYLYLVGDIVDGWSLRRSWYWPESHQEVVQKLLQKAREGSWAVYIPGNHDETFRQYAGLTLGGVRVMKEAVHVTADGRRLLVLHGDKFDGIVQCARWLAYLGDRAYQLAIQLNWIFNTLRRRLGYSYWSLSAYLKHRVKNAVSYVCGYEEAVATHARQRRVDGVVCGHIHWPEIRTIGDLPYANDGDWVESCTALVEHHDGRLEILRWTEVRAQLLGLETGEETDGLLVGVGA
jgi:UDP-2,3-diacylglucosamine pyrophosphatase LpxH